MDISANFKSLIKENQLIRKDFIIRNELFAEFMKENLTANDYNQSISGFNKLVNSPKTPNRYFKRGKILKEKFGSKLLYFPAFNNLNSKDNSKNKGKNIFIIPSLINHAYIFDIHPKNSLINYLNRQNINIYLIDWAEPSHKEDNNFGINDYATKILLPMIELAKERCEIDNIVGHCLSGVLLMLGSFLNNNLSKKLTFLSTPIDFSEYEFSNQDKTYINNNQIISGDLVYYWFYKKNKNLINKRFSKTHKKISYKEKWLLDSKNITQNLAKDLVKLNKENLILNGTWQIEGKTFSFTKLENKENIININAKNDVIVKNESKLNNYASKNIDFDTSHIGLIIGKNAESNLWKVLKNI